MFKSVLEFHNQTIDKLVSEIDQQNNLLALVKGALPKTLAENTLHCVVHGTTLLIYTNAAVWSSQLRFYEMAILDAISLFVISPVKRVQIRLVKQ